MATIERAFVTAIYGRRPADVTGVVHETEGGKGLGARAFAMVSMGRNRKGKTLIQDLLVWKVSTGSGAWGLPPAEWFLVLDGQDRCSVAQGWLECEWFAYEKFAWLLSHWFTMARNGQIQGRVVPPGSPVVKALTH